MNRPDESIRVVAVDDATAILRALTAAGIEPDLDLSRLAPGAAPTH